MMTVISNAPPGFPDVDPSGYPLFYALVPDPEDTNHPKRSIPQAGVHPRLVYADQTFADVGEIEDWKVRVKARDHNLDKWRESWLEQRWHGPIPVDKLHNASVFYLGRKAYDYAVAGKGDLFEQVLRGSNVEIAQVKQQASYNTPPNFDASTVDPKQRATIDRIAAE